MKFFPKAVKVDAVRWHKPGDHPKVERALSTPEGVVTGAHMKIWERAGSEFYGIQTPGGFIEVKSGDWVVTELGTVIRVLSPKQFSALYDNASSQPSDAAALVRRLRVTMLSVAKQLCSSDRDCEQLADLLRREAAEPRPRPEGEQNAR